MPLLPPKFVAQITILEARNRIRLVSLSLLALPVSNIFHQLLAHTSRPG
jgi:hypothetical protein